MPQLISKHTLFFSTHPDNDDRSQIGPPAHTRSSPERTTESSQGSSTARSRGNPDIRKRPFNSPSISWETSPRVHRRRVTVAGHHTGWTSPSNFPFARRKRASADDQPAHSQLVRSRSVRGDHRRARVGTKSGSTKCDVSERGQQKRDLGCDCDHAAETVLMREVAREMDRRVRRELERKRQSWRLPRGVRDRIAEQRQAHAARIQETTRGALHAEAHHRHAPAHPHHQAADHNRVTSDVLVREAIAALVTRAERSPGHRCRPRLRPS